MTKILKESAFSVYLGGLWKKIRFVLITIKLKKNSQ